MILLGHRLGNALESFGDRYAHLAVALASVLARLREGYQPDQQDLLKLAKLWTAHNDARNYIVLGDPAVRLNVAQSFGRGNRMNWLCEQSWQRSDRCH